MKKFKEQRQKLSFWMTTSKLEALMKLYQTDVEPPLAEGMFTV